MAAPLDDKITSSGWAAALVSFSLILSLNESTRLNIGGLLIHPYLLIIPVFILFGKFPVMRVNRKILYPLLAYGLFLSMAAFRDFEIGEILKVISGILTFLFFALSVKSEKDFTAISVGFIAVAAYLSYKIIVLALSGNVSLLAGVDALGGFGNKNAQSQFTLPGLFFAVMLIIDKKMNRSLIVKIVLTIIILITVLGTVYTGNRSGYLCILIILLVALRGLKFRLGNLIIVGTLIYLSIILIETYAADVFEHKLNQSTQKYTSDDQREDLFLNSLLIGLKNPLLGVGSKELTVELARRVDPTLPFKDPHNLYGYLFGAGGIYTFSFFLFFLYNIWRLSANYTKALVKRLFVDEIKINIWVSGFIFLFLVRSLFTRELIYSPNFMGGLGLLFSLLTYRRRQFITDYAQRKRDKTGFLQPT